jgi:hypothetical protein
MLVLVKECVVLLKITIAREDSILPMAAFDKTSRRVWQQGHSSLRLLVGLLKFQCLEMVHKWSATKSNSSQ